MMTPDTDCGMEEELVCGLGRWDAGLWLNLGRGQLLLFAYIYFCRLVFRLHESLKRRTTSHELRWYTTLSTEEKSNQVKNNEYMYAYSKQ
jgi:hypothetical protein